MSDVKRWYVSPRTIELFLRADPSSEIPPGFSGLVLSSAYDDLARRCRELEHSLEVKEEFYQDALHSHIVLASQRDSLRAEVEALRKDAERYRWLREQQWNTSPICAVTRPKDAVKLGHDCPSLDRLDAAIDAAMEASQ